MTTYAQAKALNAPSATCLYCLGGMQYQPYLICEPCTRQLTEEGRYCDVRDELYPLIKQAGLKTTCGPEKENQHGK